MIHMREKTFVEVLTKANRFYTAVFPLHYPPAASWSRVTDTNWVKRVWTRTLKRKTKLGLYVHIPFCASICAYCNITVRQTSTAAHRAAYLKRLYAEAKMYSSLFTKTEFQSVFIGGGTPNLLKPEQLKELFSEIRKNFNIAKNAKIVMDASPYFLDEERLKALTEGGLNGISLGGQSFDDDVIIQANRTQDNSTIYKTYLRARKFGIKHINIDIMVGLPGQSSESSLRDIRAVAAWKPDEIFLGEFSPVNTLFAKGGGRVSVEVKKESSKIWMKGFEILKKLGYHHKSQEPFVSLNPKAETWRGFFPFLGNSSILGLGLGAVSWAWQGARYQNLENLSKYSQSIDKNRFPINDGGLITARQEMIHFILASLERGWVCDTEFKAVFKESFNKRFRNHFRSLEEQGAVKRRRHSWFLTDHPRVIFLYSKVFYEPSIADKIKRRHS